MLHTVLTLDYEIHGNGDGSPRKLMLDPTARLMDLLEEYGGRLTIMADAAALIRFRAYDSEHPNDDLQSTALEQQLRTAVRRGHDVQLHFHSSYMKARFEKGRWIQYWPEYNLAALPRARIDEMIRIGKQYLESLFADVDPNYRCIAFRAANWAVQPSGNLIPALSNNGIEIDTSVFKYGRRSGLVSFDFRDAFSNCHPYRISAANVCQADPAGTVVEFPIYSEERRIGAFVSAQRVWHALSERRHPLPSAAPETHPEKKLIARFATVKRFLCGRHAWKADFNKCTGKQLIRAAQRLAATSGSAGTCIPFVVIGHSKLFTARNASALRPFLRFISESPELYGFATFRSFHLDSLVPRRT